MARYSNVEQEFLTAQVFCLLPWQRRIEGAIDRSILNTYGLDCYAKIDNRGLLRADTAARTALYQSMFNMGSITPNEIRDLEDLPLLDDAAADKTYMQLGFAPLDVAAIANAPAATPAPPSPPAPAAEPPVEDQFDLEASTPGMEPPSAADSSAADSEPSAATSVDASSSGVELDGEQLDGLLAILDRVSQGTLTAGSAVAAILAAFPDIKPEQAQKIVEGVLPSDNSEIEEEAPSGN
jgi:hypothetical protein